MCSLICIAAKVLLVTEAAWLISPGLSSKSYPLSSRMPEHKQAQTESQTQTQTRAQAHLKGSHRTKHLISNTTFMPRCMSIYMAIQIHDSTS